MTDKRKVCMLGATGVGKTSLVRRFVRSIFSETYRTTIGVTIDRKRVVLDSHELDIIIWDLSGEDEFQSVTLTYMRGASGYLLVVDGTRRGTLETAIDLHGAARQVLGPVPCVTVLNKSDLLAQWELDDGATASLTGLGPIVRTSAKTGLGVEDAFRSLALAVAMQPHRAARTG